jgi:hypothetical protein
MILFKEIQRVAGRDHVLWLGVKPVESKTADLTQIPPGWIDMRETVLHLVDQPEGAVWRHREGGREDGSVRMTRIVDQAHTCDALPERDPSDFRQPTRPIGQIRPQDEFGACVG